MSKNRNVMFRAIQEKRPWSNLSYFQTVDSAIFARHGKNRSAESQLFGQGYGREMNYGDTYYVAVWERPNGDHLGNGFLLYKRTGALFFVPVSAHVLEELEKIHTNLGLDDLIFKATAIVEDARQEYELSEDAIRQYSTMLLQSVIDKHIMQQIMTRRGQADFRRSLLVEYGGCCSISGCSDEDVLEAAHITPHSESQNYSIANGLLLRTDLHTLFDLFLISVDPRSWRIVVATTLSEQYRIYKGKLFSLPADSANYPERSALMRHYMAWKANEQDQQFRI